MRRVFLRAVLVLLLVLICVYVVDVLSLSLQIPKRPQFGSVHVQPYLAVPRKDGKTEFMMEEAVDEPCVHSMFPHFGDPPCWYLQRHKSKRDDL